MNNKLLDLSLLVVEDDIITLEMVCNHLSRKYKKVICINNPVEAISLFKIEKFDVVITDIKMRDIDGLELIKEIRNINPNIVTIIISAFGNREYLLKALELNVYKYFFKPLNYMAIDEALQYLLKDKIEYLKLKESEIAFREFVENTIDLVTKVDKYGKFIYVNGASRDIFGLEPKDMIGKSAFDFVYSEDKADTAEAFNRWIRDKEVHKNFRNRQVHRSGKVAYVCWSINIHYNLNGDVDYVNSIGRNVTNQVEMLENIREKEQNYREIFDGVIEGIIIYCVSQNKIVDINNSVCEIFGYSKEELIGKDMNFLTINTEPYTMSDLNQYIKQIKISSQESFQWCSKKRDGTTIWLDINLKFTTVGGKFRFLVVLRDITEKCGLETKLKELNDKLMEKVEIEVAKNREKDRLMFHQAKYAQMGEMISMIAHQWRQPLNAINASIIDLKVKLELDGEVDLNDLLEKSNFIENQSTKMSQTITDFMNFFKPVKVKDYFQFIDILNDISGIVGTQLRNREIDFIFSGDLHKSIFGFRNEMEHVLLNLIVNARDAFEDNPRISNKKIQISITNFQDSVLIEVTDNAGGINEDILDRVFDPYFTTKEQGKGSGIGLYMTRSIIERSFGGVISVENINAGARFSIKIPINEDK